MSIPNFARDLPPDRQPAGATDTEFRLGPLACFALGFVAGIAAILVFGDTNILRHYVITAFG